MIGALDRDSKAIKKATEGILYSYRYFNDRVCNGLDVKRYTYFSPDAYFPFKDVKADTNDCLVHAVNFALRYPWFTNREQVVRLRRVRSHKDIEQAKQEKA